MGLFDIFSNSDAQDAANAKIAGLNAGYGQAADAFGKGRDAISNYYGQAQQPFQTILNNTSGPNANLSGTGTAGYNAFGDATGANGAGGLSRADALFRATPGYTEGLNLSLDANDRRAASRGMLNSGNTIADTTKLATDYASQHYGDYVKNLSPYFYVPSQQTQDASQRATQMQGAATGNAGVLTGEGGAINSSYGNEGNLGFQTQTGIGNANASADMAKYGASQNMWGALMSGANLAAGFI